MFFGHIDVQGHQIWRQGEQFHMSERFGAGSFSMCKAMVIKMKGEDASNQYQ